MFPMCFLKRSSKSKYLHHCENCEICANDEQNPKDPKTRFSKSLINKYLMNSSLECKRVPRRSLRIGDDERNNILYLPLDEDNLVDNGLSYIRRKFFVEVPDDLLLRIKLGSVKMKVYTYLFIRPPGSNSLPAIIFSLESLNGEEVDKDIFYILYMAIPMFKSVSLKVGGI